MTRIVFDEDQDLLFELLERAVATFG